MRFNCKTCGNTELIVTHEYTIVYHDGGETWREWGPLDDDHHWDYEESEKLDFFTDWGGLEERGFDPGGNETMTDPDSHQFYVNCVGCKREIEFGWSHPDRGGRIWPAECDDFNPWKSWPEPRYRDSWHKKNWLRPST